jgi:DNA recombination-dependent growth factor C
VAKSLKRTIKKMFREFLVYHYSSLEYRAKILTLIISADGEISECEKQKLKEIAHTIYSENQERAELLIDTVNEYHTKIITNNGLNFEHLIQIVLKETREVKRFAKKIDMPLLRTLSDCVCDEDEDDILFKERLLEFLQNLKDEYGEK